MDTLYQGSHDFLNEAFSTQMSSPEGKAKIAAAGANFIRDRLREESAFDKILPPTPVSRNDLRPSLTNDTFTKVEWVEPNARAMVGTFRGDAQPQYIRAPRCEIPFYKIQSQMSEKEEMELMVYDMPITKHIEDLALKDMHEIVDLVMITHAEAALQQLQTDANGGTAVGLTGESQADGTCAVTSIVKSHGAETAADQTSYQATPLEKRDLVRLYRLFVDDGRRLRADTTLIGEGDMEEINLWTVEEVGYDIVKETTVDGYKYNTLMGRKYVRTLKTDMLRSGNLYTFAAPEFVGKSYTLGGVKFYIDKIVTKIRFQSWMYRGFGFINIQAFKKMETYAASVTPGQETDPVAALTKLPKAERNLFQPNNRVDDGLVEPKVTTF